MTGNDNNIVTGGKLRMPVEGRRPQASFGPVPLYSIPQFTGSNETVAIMGQVIGRDNQNQ